MEVHLNRCHERSDYAMPKHVCSSKILLVMSKRALFYKLGQTWRKCLFYFNSLHNNRQQTVEHEDNMYNYVLLSSLQTLIKGGCVLQSSLPLFGQILCAGYKNRGLFLIYLVTRSLQYTLSKLHVHYMLVYSRNLKLLKQE